MTTEIVNIGQDLEFIAKCVEQVKVLKIKSASSNLRISSLNCSGKELEECDSTFSDFINIDDTAEDIEESQKDALVYAAGYVGKMTSKWTLSCSECSYYFVSSTYLEADVSVNAQEYFNFINRGGLKMSTKATINIFFFL